TGDVWHGPLAKTRGLVDRVEQYFDWSRRMQAEFSGVRPELHTAARGEAAYWKLHELAFAKAEMDGAGRSLFDVPVYFINKVALECPTLYRSTMEYLKARKHQPDLSQQVGITKRHSH